MHKYVLQRVDHLAQSAAWQTVAELHDSLSVRHRDLPPRPGMYQYRLAVSSKPADVARGHQRRRTTADAYAFVNI
jgi:hypothetical protein